MSSRSDRVVIPLVVLAATLCVSASAQPVPSATSAIVSVQRGQTLDLAVPGSNLGAVASAVIAEPEGLDVSILKPDKPDENQSRLRFVAAADAPPGEREVRLVSPTGVSNPLRVVVEQYPLLAESEPNDTPQQAQSAVLPAVMVGTIGRTGDVDCFRFDARKGQHLVFDVSAARTGSPLDATVALYDASRKELASNNDTHGPDPFLAVDIPADGSYTLEIRDLQYRGGGDYVYRITAGPIPYVEALMPMTSQRGKVVQVQAVGHNLQGYEKVRLDLTYAQPGRVRVRATTPLGVSNSLPFEITDAPPALEAEPNDSAEKANAVSLPAEVSGRVERDGDEDYFKFKVAQKQVLNIEVVARRLGSPLDALLMLRDAKSGNVIETNDDAAGADARITREVDAGEYVVSVRDLAYAGGPDHAYRLTIEPTAAAPQEFAVRFIPDAVRIRRGGNAMLRCEVARMNGFSGDVTVTLEGLPRGVTAAPVTLREPSSGVFTVSASADANLGSVPIRLKASGMVGGRFVTREAQPELDGRRVRQAYLTVLEAAPFTVETLVNLPPERIQQFAGEITALAAKLNAPGAELEARQAEWEKKVLASAAWTTLDVTSAQSTGGATLTKQPDGSVLAGGTRSERDIYTVVAQTDVKGVRAIRLEVLTDPSLPSKGPGRADNGNFVVTRFLVTSAPKSAPSNTSKIKLVRPRATFEQSGYPARNAIDSDEQGDPSGWAIAPQMGRSHAIIFSTDEPVGTDGGTVFTFVMDHDYGQQHVVGKFRLSVSTDPAASDAPVVPEAVLAAVKLPADKRTPEQKAQVAEYYRGIDPQLASDRERLEALRNLIAPQAEMMRLESVLNTQTPQLDTEMAQWERRVLAGATWAPVEFVEMKSDAGASFSKEPDGSVVVGGASAPVDNYKLTATSPLRGITAVRLEVLPDPRLPDNGPGRGANGNFILTRFALAAAPKANPAQSTPVELHSPQVSVEQQGWSVLGTLDDRNDTGWGVGGYAGRPAAATFSTRSIIPGGEENLLQFTLEHQAAASPQHTIGRFRIWVTNALDPQAAPKVPDRILALLRDTQRDGREKGELAAYYRSVAPSLEPVRQRLAELRSRVGGGRPTVARNEGGAVPVLINRVNNFAGEVSVTLEGFTSGREGNTPRPIDRSLKSQPLKLAGTFGTLGFQADPGAETGTRMVVLRAEAKVGDQTVVEYSPAFPMTVN